MIQPGTTLQQRYKIDKQIGQGGMGAVYVATDVRFGSTVAIKETLCMDDNFRKAIEREARLLNSLKHTALPRVSDHFEESDGMFLVMEYIPGDDIAAMLEGRSEPFPVDQVLKWADQLLDALDYLHTQEMPVIHRDIKPQNLKLNSRGEMILLDFGLAKGNPSDVSHQTAAKSIFGYSRNYASLEQIQGTGTDPRSDLYSLAATLYHLITNVAPEDALTRAMSVLSQKGDPLPPASQLNPLVPIGVAGVLQKALDLNASERPTSAAEMRQMFRQSEEYGYLADSVAAAQLPTQAQVFAQPTRLMSDATRSDSTHQHNVMTEVMPAQISQPTSVRAPDTMPPAKSRGSGFAVAAGALSVLLIGAAIAGGFYLVDPSIFGTTVQTPTEPAANAPVAVTSESNANTERQKAEALAGASTTSPDISTVDVAPPTGDRQKDTAKSSKPDEAKQTTRVDLGDDMVVEMDNLEDPKNVVITTKDPDGTVKTLRVTPQMPPPDRRGAPPPGFDPFPRDFDPNNLTPAQRRKFQQLMRNRQIQQQQMQKLPPTMRPPTQPTPPK
ncbi:MAG: serine/threonine-protein kinase [Pyrinomonadaceae bacterium]